MKDPLDQASIVRSVMQQDPRIHNHRIVVARYIIHHVFWMVHGVRTQGILVDIVGNLGNDIEWKDRYLHSYLGTSSNAPKRTP